MAFIRSVIRECKIYGVIAFVVVTIWVYAQSNALEQRVERMMLSGRPQFPALVEGQEEGVRVTGVNVDYAVGE